MGSEALEKLFCASKSIETLDDNPNHNFEDLDTSILQLKNFIPDLEFWLGESERKKLREIVQRLEKSVAGIKTVNSKIIKSKIEELFSQFNMSYPVKLTVEVAAANLALDYNQYLDFVAAIKFFLFALPEKDCNQLADKKFLISFFIERDQVVMGIDSNLCRLYFEDKISSAIAEYAKTFNFMLIVNEYATLNLLLKAQRRAYYQDLLMIEVSGFTLALNQEAIIGVIRTEYFANNTILFKGENLPLINMRKFLNFTEKSSSDQKLNFANVFNDDKTEDKQIHIVLVKTGNYKYGLIVDDIAGTGEFKVYPNHIIFQEFGYYIGVIEQENKKMSLVVDPALMIQIYERNKEQIYQNSISNPHHISEMINYLIDFEEKIQRLGNQVKLHPKDVLVLEDSPLFRKLIRKRLEDEANNVFIFDDSNLALEYLKQHRQLNLVIADFGISDIDGVLFAKKCKEIRATINIISLTSAIEAAELKNKALDHLFYAFVSKTDQEKIVKIVNEILINEIENNGI